MKWYKGETDLRDHPKRFELEELLGVDHGLHYLHLWFSYVAKYYLEGDVTGMSPKALANWCEWKGDPELFIDALIGSGFLEKNKGGKDGFRLIAHNWYEKNKRFIDENQRRKPKGNPQKKCGKPLSIEEKRIEEKRKEYIPSPECESIYKAYPTKTQRGDKQDVSTGKSLADKKKIDSVLKSGYDLASAVEIYVPSTTHHKNLGTFLNKLPDLEALEVEPEKDAPCVHEPGRVNEDKPTHTYYLCKKCKYEYKVLK